MLKSKTEKQCKQHTQSRKLTSVLLDPNKAHRYDMISIRMLKICGKSIIKPLLIIYKKCLEKGCFPSKLKKANVVPVHKKMTSSY